MTSQSLQISANISKHGSSDKKFELMLTKCAKAYSSSGSVV